MLKTAELNGNRPFLFTSEIVCVHTGEDPGEGGSRDLSSNLKCPFRNLEKKKNLYIIIRLSDYFPIFYSLDT